MMGDQELHALALYGGPGDLNAECPLSNCSRSFGTIAHLKRHVREVHGISTTLVLKFRCVKCGYEIVEHRAHSIGKHVRECTGQLEGEASAKPSHSCRECSRAFLTRQGLEAHAGKVHVSSQQDREDGTYLVEVKYEGAGRNDDLVCPVGHCKRQGRPMSSARVLRRHMRTAHNASLTLNVSCALCGETFGNSEGLIGAAAHWKKCAKDLFPFQSQQELTETQTTAHPRTRASLEDPSDVDRDDLSAGSLDERRAANLDEQPDASAGRRTMENPTECATSHTKTQTKQTRTPPTHVSRRGDRTTENPGERFEAAGKGLRAGNPEEQTFATSRRAATLEEQPDASSRPSTTASTSRHVTLTTNTQTHAERRGDRYIVNPDARAETGGEDLPTGILGEQSVEATRRTASLDEQFDALPCPQTFGGKGDRCVVRSQAGPETSGKDLPIETPGEQSVEATLRTASLDERSDAPSRSPKTGQAEDRCAENSEARSEASGADLRSGILGEQSGDATRRTASLDEQPDKLPRQQTTGQKKDRRAENPGDQPEIDGEARLTENRDGQHVERERRVESRGDRLGASPRRRTAASTSTHVTSPTNNTTATRTPTVTEKDRRSIGGTQPRPSRLAGVSASQ